MRVEQHVMNIAALVPVYKTVHFAVSDRLYSDIACHTNAANLCSTKTDDVNCGRCKQTLLYKYSS